MIMMNGLMPHPPIIVDGVGGSRASEAAATQSACRELAQAVVTRNPDRVVVISPHTPRPHRGVALWTGDVLHGDFGQFGAPQTKLALPIDRAWIERFTQSHGAVHDLGDHRLDHGAAVPLFFLDQAGWQGPTVVVSLPMPNDEAVDHLGDAIKQASADDRATVLIASGDMSHCLKPGAPSGHDERGAVFDQAFVGCIRAARYRDAANLEADLRQAACQDVVETCRASWQATDYASEGHQFFNYEGPFGVGYAVMCFFRRLT